MLFGWDFGLVKEKTLINPIHLQVQAFSCAMYLKNEEEINNE